MGRVRHDELSAHPGLAVALRWLRHRRRLTQVQLREAVEASGGRVSVIYIQQLEAGRRRPSPQLLGQLLAGLGSDRAELSGLLDQAADRPAPARERGWRPSRRDPVRPHAGESWSDEVEMAGVAPAPGPPQVVAAAARAPEAGQVEGLEALVAELRRIAGELDPIGRRELLHHARRLAARRRAR